MRRLLAVTLVAAGCVTSPAAAAPSCRVVERLPHGDVDFAADTWSVDGHVVAYSAEEDAVMWTTARCARHDLTNGSNDL